MNRLLSLVVILYLLISCECKLYSKLTPLTLDSLSFVFEPNWEELDEGFKLSSYETPSTPELANQSGYPVETYKIKTEDQYILTVHRIPCGKNISSCSEELDKPAVLLQHGMLQSSSDWLMNEDVSLPYKLADAGFDVWLGNARGNKYSVEHGIINEDTTEFYNFTFHEMGKYDVPAMIDFILDKTNQSKLSYIGCSLGTSLFWVTMSERPEYSSKIQIMAAISPVAFLNHTTSPVRILAEYSSELNNLFTTLRAKRFNPPKLESIVNTYLPRLCFFRMLSRSLCSSIFNVLEAFNMRKFERHHIELVTKYAPTTTSIRTMIHFLQLISFVPFKQYDFGNDDMNQLAYGQSVPSVYNLTNSNVPTVLFTGPEDTFSNPKDISMLVNSLPQVIDHIEVDESFKSHVDFTHELKAAELIYDPLIKIMSNNNNQSSDSDDETQNNSYLSLNSWF